MKKKLSLILISMVLTTSLFGCGSNNAESTEADAPKENTQSEEVQKETPNLATLKLKDGAYHAEGSADDKGWTPTTDVIIENGKITAITFDDFDASGMFKSQAVADGNYDMIVNGAKASWTDEIATLAEAIVNQTIDIYNISLTPEGKTDAVSGCTITVAPYIELVKSAVEQAKI